MNKEEIKEIIIKNQLEHIQNLENSIEEKMVTVDVDESEVLDPEDYSRQTEVGDLVMRLKQQLIAAKGELKSVEETSTEKKDSAVLGALVETENFFFYISISSSPVEYQGKSLVGISTKAPIYQSMFNKKKGEKFAQGDKAYTILNLW